MTPTYLLQGCKLLTHPKLRYFVLIPLTINTLVFALLLTLSIHWFGDMMKWIDGFLPHWLHWLNWLLWIFFALASWLSVIYSFSIIANLIAAPFNALLAEKAEELVTGKASELDAGVAAALKDIPRVLKHELHKIIYYLPRAILCLALFIIPGIQVLAPLIWFLFNGWMMSIQYIDYPMDNHKIAFREIRRQLASKKATNLGFGITVMLASMLPIINFIVMPAAVVGATVLWTKEYHS
ncbi:MAG: sulfate transporter CysZ [Gammaproteobacteria bacterium]|nr:sulfate transporter CysZ [Gammaproteobacteria bacterium]